MPIKLSPETHEKISSLCKKISVAHNLDDEIQKELHCHMEDKLTGYLSGDEKITEEDAFILVEKHFGDPKTIRLLYQDVEAIEAHVSFARRIGAVLALSIWIIYTASYILEIILSSLFTWSLKGNVFPESNMILIGIPEIIPNIFSLLLFTVILMHWRKNMEYGRKPWFLKINMLKFFGIIFGSFFGMYLIIITTHQFQANSFNQLTLTFGRLTVIAHCLIWIWWCDSQPRRLLAVLYGSISWVASQILIWVVFASLSDLRYRPNEVWQTIRYSITYYLIYFGRPGTIALGFYLLLVGVHIVYMKFKPELVN